MMPLLFMTVPWMALFSQSNRSKKAILCPINAIVRFTCLQPARKQAVNSQNQELEALEARLRETEQRLKERQSRNSSPAGKSGGSPHRRKPLGDTFSGQENDRAQPPATSPLATQAPMSQPVMPSTISQWRPDTRESSSGTARITGDMPVGQPAVQQESRFAE